MRKMQPLAPIVDDVLGLCIGVQLLAALHFRADRGEHALHGGLVQVPGETGVGFKDYKGNPEVLESARQVVTLLKGVKRFKLMGGQPIRGLLLEGPPGTGKSYLGQAIATEAQLPFGYMSAPSIQGMFWGMDTLRVLSLYNKARKLARKHGACILFIDEIDAIGKSRSGVGNAGGMMGGMMMGGGGGALNELLNQMDPLPKDGFKDKILRMFGMRKGKAEQPPVLTIAATNLVSVLDQALLRPGRFDRQLRIGAPSYDGRREIFDFYLGKVKHVDLPIDQMVAETVNYTPAQIKHIVNEAVVHAVWNGRDAIDYEDFRWALETYEWGMRMPVIGMTYADKRRLAYHEAGHAVAAVKLLKRYRVARATIEGISIPPLPLSRWRIDAFRKSAERLDAGFLEQLAESESRRRRRRDAQVDVDEPAADVTGQMVLFDRLEATSPRA